LPSGCNQNIPGWGDSLGTVTFDSQGHNVVIEGNGIAQIWSGAVTATACQKTTFNDSILSNADCRSNPGFPGDLFSWCAVIRFADVLCPHPWRVPTEQDFIDLDVAMGGTGNWRREDVDFVNTNYITRWGGAFSGFSLGCGMLVEQGFVGMYWAWLPTRYPYHPVLDVRLFDAQGAISPHGLWGSMYNGLTLRCVR